MRWNRKTISAVIALLVILPLALSWNPLIAVRLKAAVATINLLIYEGDWRPLELTTRSPLIEEYSWQSPSGRQLQIDLYQQPADAKKSKLDQQARPALIIYSPFIDDGSNDPRLVNLANTFARLGFITVVPQRIEGQLIMSTKDVEDIVETVLFLKNKPDLNIGTVGLFGISYGNGPVIAASSDPRIKQDVSFIISFGGYYDIKNLFNFVTTGEYSYQDIKGRVEPHSYAREILAKTLAYYNASEETLLTSNQFEKLRADLSPSSFTDEADDDFYILHSTDDAFIPFTESMRLADALKERVPVQFALINSFEHGTYKELTSQNIRRYYLPSINNLYRLMRTLLSHHL